ncbi:MAG: zraS 9 [Phycisphaerales bacterium]|nr:zraS 9 [Phycisphaerales bacterium]
MAMNLKHKFVLWSAVLLAGVLIIGSVSVWNLSAMWRGARAATAEYEAMDRADGVLVEVTWLRDTLRGGNATNFRAVTNFTKIQTEVTEIVRGLRLAAGWDDGDAAAQLDLARAASQHLDAAVQLSTSEGGAPTPAKSLAAAAELESVRQSLVNVSKLVPGSARRHVIAAADRLLSRLVWTCGLLLLVLAISAAIHFTQYRALVRPLLGLRDDMRVSAAREFRDEIKPRGGAEFKDVAVYFNGLARELAGLYRNLEQKVIARSRELVRSERLASVGFLAAGVAHEINNPLSVISGYAELAGKGLRRVMLGGGEDGGAIEGPQAEVEAETLAAALEAQGIIRDEAFRCKEITSRLLSLARGGGDGRETLCLDEVARQVSVLTKGLKNYRDRRVVLDFDQAQALQVVANPTEMKQVLMNLTVNALEAAPADRGEVRIGGRRSGSWVEIFVEDNGKGMSPGTLEHVFEPFFTAKRGAGEPGTGLGLSISHAIIESHGGRIRAESNGPGRGSRFTVQLPAGAAAAVAGSTALVTG